NDHPPRPAARVDVSGRTVRRPADVPVRITPGDPRRRPDVSGNPEPAQPGAEAPAAVVEHDRAPRHARYERPPPCRLDPVTVRVRLPIRRDGGHPDDTVFGSPLPVTVRRELTLERALIERL